MSAPSPPDLIGPMSDEVGDFGFVIQLQSVMSNPSEAGQLRQRLRQALVVAMKARDSMATTALRTTLGAIDNAEAVDISDRHPPQGGPIAGAVVGHGAGEAPRRELSEEQISTIVQGEVADRESSAADYERLGRHDEATRVRTESAVLIALLRNN
jgi:uncharacterized protein YqeY